MVVAIDQRSHDYDAGMHIGAGDTVIAPRDHVPTGASMLPGTDEIQ